jgi:multicomponent Na+:H+ antiporter subunit B
LKWIGIIGVGCFGALLFYGALDFPIWGDPQAPASRHVSPYYIEKALEDTSVSNIVTAVLADYRSFDTLFETIVIFTAGIACILILRRFRPVEGTQTRLYRHIPTGITLRVKNNGRYPERSNDFERIDSVWIPYNLIVKTTCRLIMPFIQIFALYVIAHGHHSPGGGFQGGVILGASMILYAIAFDLRSALKRMSERVTALLCTLGVLIYAGTGIAALLYEKNYLDYSALAPLLATDPVSARSHGILLVEIGVGIAVMAVMVVLYYNLASAGKHDEGL